MSSIKTRKTVTQMTSAPSTFGMPACGHAFGSADVTTGVITAQAEVRVKGDMGLDRTDLAVRTYAPGTIAWSPPLS